MTPQERLKEIVDSWKNDDGPGHEDVNWLADRVKQLETINWREFWAKYYVTCGTQYFPEKFQSCFEKFVKGEL